MGNCFGSPGESYGHHEHVVDITTGRLHAAAHSPMPTRSFTVGGLRWRMEYTYHPEGRRLSLRLIRDGEFAMPVAARVSLSLKVKDRVAMACWSPGFVNLGMPRGYKDFNGLDTSNLRWKMHKAQTTRFTIRCDITVATGKEAMKRLPKLRPPPPQSDTVSMFFGAAVFVSVWIVARALLSLLV